MCVERKEQTVPQNLYLDECVPPLLKDRISLPDPQRFHIEHANQVARGMSDPEQLRYAAKTQAVLITYNIRDFLWLHRWWKTLHAWDLLPDPHPGILAAPDSVRIDQLGTDIFRFLTQQPVPLLANTMYIYRQQQRQWVRERW